MDETGRIGGYRVLRRIANGARSTVLLAHGGEPPRTVVLKVTAADDPGALREAAALDRGAGEHVVPVLDAHADDDRLVLVMPRLDGDLARLLAERTELEGGEAVTVLAPVAATIARLHAAGVAHGALSPADVRFDPEGAPVLTGFGTAAAFDPGLPEIELERVPEVGADRAALRGLASAVLGRVGGARRGAAQRLLAEVLQAPDAVVAHRIGAGIFEVAAARPVRAEDPPSPAAGTGSRLVPIASPVEETEAPRTRGWAGRWSIRVERLLDRSPAGELRAVVARCWVALSTGRRRAMLGIGVGALVLVVALAVVPNGAAPGAAAGTPTDSRSGIRPVPSADRSPSASPVPSGPPGALRGDDPVAAVTVLLRERAACRHELSVLCLDGVEQDGSAAAEADRNAIRAAQDGGEMATDPLPAATGAAPQLTERIGGSALVTVAGGASLLIVREDDGWRIRDILTRPAQTSTPSPGG